MKLTNLTIKDLITPEAKLTFLVGAGCSRDKPSCLPMGGEMIEGLINYVCVDSEIDKILGKKELKDGRKLEGLRFEALAEIIRDILDPDLKFIDFYGLCDKPNVQHFFLAEMMIKGQFVLTTNFDFLIEYALQQLGIPKEDVKVVITKDDFKKFNNPQELYLKGLKALYKIHGSTRNIFTDDSTRDSLIATIQAFGTNKEGKNIFQLEHFKQPAFTNLTKNRSLVIMGYSGSDDFDVVPTLIALQDVQDFIWIHHVHDDESKELFYEIEMDDIDNYGNLTKVDRILVNIKRMNSANHVYRLDVNTTSMVRELLDFKPKLSSDNFSFTLLDWFENNIRTPSEFIRLQIPSIIYNNLSMLEDEMRCAEEVLRLAIVKNDEGWKAMALNDIAHIYYTQGNYLEALKRQEEVLQIAEKLGNLSLIASILNNIAEIYRVRGNYPEALKRYYRALKIIEQLGNLTGTATTLNNIAEIYRVRGNYHEALKRYYRALKIIEQLGDISRKASILINIGVVYYTQGNYPKALKLYYEALNIDHQLGNLSGKATALNNIGEIYRVGEIHFEALKWYQKALRIDDQLGNLSGKATRLNNIGLVYDAQGNYPEAIKCYEEALKIDDQLGNLSGKATRLNNIGFIYKMQGNYSEALKRYYKALKIIDQLEDLFKKALTLNNIGRIYDTLGNYSEALKWCEEAFKILIDLGLSESPNTKAIKFNIDYIKSKME